jgi:4-hydroxybenzoate polyprenyltransferase
VSGVLRTASALARSCHPAPSAGVTAFATVLAVTAGNGAGTCALLALAVLAGQLSIGWSNDRLDAARDRAVARTDKPIATGELAHRTVEVAIAVALAACVACSLALGWRAGLLHLAAVSCGWLYNLWLKATWFSWLPYAAAFGALPAIAVLAVPGHPAPAAWPIAAGACLGVAAHLTNVLPDLAGDRATGIRGLPHRIGARASLALTGPLLVAATGCAAFGPPGVPFLLGWLAFAVSVVVAVLGPAVLWRRPAGKLAFYAIFVVVALELAVIVADGHRLR